jgi:hypothetical protein
MRKGLCGFVLIMSVAAVGGCHRERHEGDKIALHLPVGTPKRPQGMAALTVTPGAVPFSEADVAAYFKTHNLPKNMGSVDQLKVDKVEFLTSGEVTKRLQGASPGIGDDERVAFVTLVGDFIFTGPQAKPVTFHRAYAVFDAVSGSLLMIGTLDRRE